MDQDSLYALEQMIDRYGLEEVLSGISYICSEKAEHVAVNWQDTTLGKQWMKRATMVDACNAKINPTH